MEADDLSPSRWWIPGVILSAVLAGVLGAALLLGLGQGSNSEEFTLNGQPPEVADDYVFVAEHAEHAARIPCYCGCVELQHRHLLDCFVKPDGGWESHASECGVCREEASDLRVMLLDGTGIDDIRQAIDARYARLGKPTNTP